MSDSATHVQCILVTGGCGAIGGCLLDYLLDNTAPGTRIINVDKVTYSAHPKNIEKPGVTLYRVDVCDHDALLDVLLSERPQIIFHLAAETHVDQSFESAFAFTRSNVLGTHSVLECVRKCSFVERLVHMSTDEVYGSVDDDGEACQEHSMYAPSNPYSATKAAAEMLCMAYVRSFKTPLIITRCNNAISPYQNSEKLVPQCVERIWRGERVPVHGQGQAKRSFIHGLDIARALYIVAAKGALGHVYNIGSNDEYSVIQVIQTVLALMRPGEPLEDWITLVPDRAFQDYRYSVDWRALRELGWEQKISFQDAVRNVISAHRELSLKN